MSKSARNPTFVAAESGASARLWGLGTEAELEVGANDLGAPSPTPNSHSNSKSLEWEWTLLSGRLPSAQRKVVFFIPSALFLS